MDQRDDLLHRLLYFFQPVLVHDPLFNHLHLLHRWHLHTHLHDLFDNLLHFFDLLDGLNYGYYLFDDSLYDLRHLLDVIDHLSRRLIVDCIHQFLHDSLHLDNHRFFNNPLYDLLYNFLNLLDPFFNLLYNNSLLPYDLHLFYLWHRLVDYLFNDDRLLHLNDLLPHHLHLHHLRHFHPLFYYLLDKARHFHDLLLYLLHLHDLLYYLVHVFDCLDGHVHDLLHLLDFGILHDLLNYFLDGDDSWHFNYPLHYLLYYLWHLHDLLAHLERLQDIIDGRVSYFLVNHLHHGLVNLWIYACLFLYLL